MEWSADFFKRLRLCLEEQREKVNYSLSSGTDDLTDFKFFSIIFKVTKGTEFIGLKVKCSLISTNRVFECLMNEVISINQSKKK